MGNDKIGIREIIEEMRENVKRGILKRVCFVLCGVIAISMVLYMACGKTARALETTIDVDIVYSNPIPQWRSHSTGNGYTTWRQGWNSVNSSPIVDMVDVRGNDGSFLTWKTGDIIEVTAVFAEGKTIQLDNDLVSSHQDRMMGFWQITSRGNNAYVFQFVAQGAVTSSFITIPINVEVSTSMTITNVNIYRPKKQIDNTSQLNGINNSVQSGNEAAQNRWDEENNKAEEAQTANNGTPNTDEQQSQANNYFEIFTTIFGTPSGNCEIGPINLYGFDIGIIDLCTFSPPAWLRNALGAISTLVAAWCGIKIIKRVSEIAINGVN